MSSCVDGQRTPPPPWHLRGLLPDAGLGGQYPHQLAQHHGECVRPRARWVVEELVPHALDGALLGLDDLGRHGAQPLDEAVDLARVRVGVRVRVSIQG